jgi:hypothetical protein
MQQRSKVDPSSRKIPRLGHSGSPERKLRVAAAMKVLCPAYWVPKSGQFRGRQMGGSGG